tara:strand:- start:213 stop:413 length:201 start_codon:yes stop_codon:yes gene_type:complete
MIFLLNISNVNTKKYKITKDKTEYIATEIFGLLPKGIFCIVTVGLLFPLVVLFFFSDNIVDVTIVT